MHELQRQATKDKSRLDIYQMQDISAINSPTTQCAHMDGGSMVTTCHDLRYVYHPKPIKKGSVVLRVADNRPHYPTHTGYLAIPCPSRDEQHILVQTYLTPTLPVIILSPDAIAKQHRCEGYTAVSYLNGTNCAITLTHCLHNKQNIKIPCQLHRGLLYSNPIPPVSDDPDLAERILHPTLTSVHHSSTPCSDCNSSPTSPANDIHHPSPPVTCHACTQDSSSPSSTCHPCKASYPSPPSTSTSIGDKIDTFRRLGYQSDVSLSTLSRKVHGIPTFADPDPPFLRDKLPSRPPSILDSPTYSLYQLTRDQL